MKRIFKYMFVALMATATFGFAACSDDDNNSNNPNNPDMPSYESLAGTEWEGVYNTVLQGYPYGAPQLLLRWTIDFRENGQCPMMVVFDSPNIEDTPTEWTSGYTYDPATMTGQILDDEMDNPTFVLDPINRTITINLVFYAQHEENGPMYEYGGETTLHQVM